jgi:DNA modification methylase
MTAPKIVMPSQIVMRATASLIGYARNSRTHDERQIDVLCKSITEYGFTNPILIDGDRGVIAGHGRIMAAEKLGLVEVPCIELRHLTNEQKRAYLILDNQSALMSTWSEALLAQELADLSGVGIEATDLGFDAEEVDRLMETLGVDFGGKAEGDPDAVPEAPVVPTSKLGDVWLLGKHRVMCGDSTDRAQVERLMDGEKADMVFTDPPYNVAVVGGCKNPLNPMYQSGRKIDNDSMSNDDFKSFLLSAYAAAYTNSRAGASIYVCHADSEGVNFRTAMTESGWLLKQCLIWVKSAFVFGRQDYHWQHEQILYGWKDGAAHCFHGSRNQSTTWNFDRPGPSNKEHPTMKPIELVEKAIFNSSMESESVLDLFGGSGSTLIACEKTGREARLMELAPNYVDVIVRRWQDFTGQAATLDDDDRTFAEIAEVRRA